MEETDKQTDEQVKLPDFSEADKRETNFHNFVEDKEVAGKLQAIEDGTYGSQYKILTEKGTVTIGTYDVLKSKIHENDVGKFIKVVSVGDVLSPKTKRKYKDFEVYIKA